MPSPPKSTNKTYEIARLAALSDGVFAIVITLLVLDLKLPDPPLPGTNIGDELRANVPDLLGWLVSFVVIARFWIIHHDVVARLTRCGARTIVLNFAFLGALSLVPFGSSLVGIYDFAEPVSVLVFSLGLGLAAFLLGVFTWSAAREVAGAPGGHGLDPHLRHHLVVVPALAGVSMLLVLVHPLVTMAVWIVESATVTFAVVTGSWDAPEQPDPPDPDDPDGDDGLGAAS